MHQPLSARTLPRQLLKMPLEVGTGTVRMIWRGRTIGSPAHAWVRGLVQQVGDEIG